jgi:alkaline phosphatase D
MPLGLVVPDGPTAIEAVAQGDPGGPVGRELEIAGLLTQLRGIPNIVWVTADVHHCAAHHYDPANARYTDFDPFWEFVAGPVHAGTFGPNALDSTFGPTVMFQKAAAYPNMVPSQGFQFFGHATITDRGRRVTVRLIDVAGTVLFSTDLDAT